MPAKVAGDPLEVLSCKVYEPRGIPTGTTNFTALDVESTANWTGMDGALQSSFEGSSGFTGTQKRTSGFFWPSIKSVPVTVSTAPRCTSMGAALAMAGLAVAEPVAQNIDGPTAIVAQNQAAVRTRNTRRKSERIVCPHE